MWPKACLTFVLLLTFLSAVAPFRMRQSRTYHENRLEMVQDMKVSQKSDDASVTASVIASVPEDTTITDDGGEENPKAEDAILQPNATEEDATAFDTAYCRGGSDQTLCPQIGDNFLSIKGGGMCKFVYTWHNGTREDTGSPVVTSGTCNLTKAGLETGTATNERVRLYVRALAAHDGFRMDDAGHILANQLGGCGTCPVNLFPQSLKINRGEYRIFEGNISECLHRGDADTVATVSWRFLYNKPSYQHLRPVSVIYDAVFSSPVCAALSKTFPNPASA